MNTMLDEVTWVVPGQILCAQFSGKINRTQMQQLNDALVTALDDYTLPHSVNVIIDVTAVTHYDPDMSPHIRPVSSDIRMSRAVNWLVIVDPYPNPILRFVGLMLSSLMRYRYHVAKSRDEAIIFITANPPQLPAG